MSNMEDSVGTMFEEDFLHQYGDMDDLELECLYAEMILINQTVTFKTFQKKDKQKACVIDEKQVKN
ncbi:hypothetical protein RIR_e14015_A0A2N0QQC7_9GLOM [Rhizophagus irregularis DAOM 181602=DAOM 197198]|nr:hypothetical protein RIR_e14015_A0A2N0QQC7_9GLOM [Rhizophagus irregularis DAOM 181602=DAOM 197198]